MKLCVMGLGYIGLPTAVMFAKHGMEVVGVDVNEKVVQTLRSGKLHIEEPGLEELLNEVIAANLLKFSSKPEEADAFIIAVPTPIENDRTANLSYVKNATEMILPYLKEGNLVVLESTVPPNTVNNVLIPILKHSTLKIGEELFVSHSPERVLPGKLLEELVSNDRIVGGINHRSSEMTVALYKRFAKGKFYITDTTTAEMVKLMENTYRDVNIALANEFARIAEVVGFNVWEAIQLANYHPRVHLHYPGPGVGGHCIAVDPWFIIEQAPSESRLIAQARDINISTPHHVYNVIETLVNKSNDANITILGLSFKGNIDDMRESPSVEIVGLLKQNEYNVKIFDPHIKQEVPGKFDSLEEAVRESDCIVIVTDHEAYRKISPHDLIRHVRNPIVYDTRNILNRDLWVDAGFKVFTIGSHCPNINFEGE